jgi:hypothetical protein
MRLGGQASSGTPATPNGSTLFQPRHDLYAFNPSFSAFALKINSKDSSWLLELFDADTHLGLGIGSMLLSRSIQSLVNFGG